MYRRVAKRLLFFAAASAYQKPRAHRYNGLRLTVCSAVSSGCRVPLRVGLRVLLQTLLIEQYTGLGKGKNFYLGTVRNSYTFSLRTTVRSLRKSKHKSGNTRARFLRKLLLIYTLSGQ
jgi:hypothetical protein